MKMFHRDDLQRIGSAELQDQARHVNDAMNAALDVAVRRTYGPLEADGWNWVEAAVKAIPYGLIRDYIARAVPIPDWVDDAVREASGAVLRHAPPR